jgi:uncharacterized membrane protein YphA (DoxX/SURF4 family)
MDPVITAITCICMSLLFAVAAMHKIKAPAVFKAAMEDYHLIPGKLLGLSSILLIILELSSAIMVLIPFTMPLGLAIMAILLSLYATGIGINLYRGRRDIDCGCNGPATTQPLSWWLVFRNLLFLGLILLAMEPSINRSLNWLDFFTIVSGSLVASGLYLGFNQLLAQAPRLASLRVQS